MKKITKRKNKKKELLIRIKNFFDAQPMLTETEQELVNEIKQLIK